MSTDSEIILRSLDDPGAFAEIFERHVRSVRAFAAYRLGEQLAEDVLSETFLVAFRRRADFLVGTDSAGPWLLGIASRLIRRHRSNEARQWRNFAEASATDAHFSLGGMEEAQNRVDAERRLAALRSRIAALAPRDREALLLFAWQDLTYEEIAAVQGVPIGTVRSRLNRVRKKLDPGRRGSAAHARDLKGEEVGRV